MSGKTFFSDFFGCVKAAGLMAAFLVAFAAGSARAAEPGAEAHLFPPVVEISGDRISVRAENAPLQEILAEVSRLTLVPIKVDEDNDHAVTINSRFSSVDELLRHMGENLAVVYEKLQDGGFRIVRAEVHKSAKTVQPEPAGSPIACPPVFDPQTESGGKPLEIEENFDSGRPVSTSVGIRKFPAMEDRPLYRPDQLLVRFKPEAGPAEISDLHDSMDCRVLRILPRSRIHQVSLPEGALMEVIAAEYRASQLVEKVGKNALRYPMGTFPDDPGFKRNQQWALSAINAPQAWSINTGSPDIVVAVIDTGVDYTHPDLAPNIWVNTAEFHGAPGVDDDKNGFVDDRYGWDFADDNPDPMDRFNHGTGVAGIIAAAGNNSIGISGVSWRAKILPLKAMADGGEYLDSASIIAAIDYAIAAGARIVNCSFGGTQYDPFERNAFERLREAGILAVCAAGNSGRNNDVNPLYPASYGLDNIISVASTNEAGTISNNSNFGANSVHLAAPGDNILSTVSAEGPTEADVRVGTGGGAFHQAIGMEYSGTTRPEGMTGVLYDCGYGYSADFPAGVNGNVALIKRGSMNGSDFYFYQKVGNAMAKGATAVVIYNNRVDGEDDNFDTAGGTLGYSSAWIPAVSVSMADGRELLAMSPQPVTVRNVPLDADSRYAAGTGTSFAAPHVSGVAALLYSIDPALDYLQARSALLESVSPLSAGGEKIVSAGVLNALDAILSLKPPAGDLTCNYRIGLEDAIVALQVTAGTNAPVCPDYSPLSDDPEKDRRIGLAEAIHALQVLAYPP